MRRAEALLRDSAAAEDVMHDVFIKAIRDGAFRGDASPTTWLYRVTTNQCLNRLRDQKTRARILRENLSATANVSPECSPQTMAILVDLLPRLPDDLSEIAVYYYVDQMKHEEIAELLGVSRRTIGNRLTEFKGAAKELVEGDDKKKDSSASD